MNYSIAADILSFDTVLKHISQEAIYSNYLGESIREDVRFRSVFRSNDSVPSLSFYATANGWIKYKDFGMNYRAGNVFTFVKTLYNLNNEWEAVVQINHDFGLGLMNTSKTIPKQSLISSIVDFKEKIKRTEKILSFTHRPFMERDLYYWHKFNVNINTLQKFNVHCADVVYINNLPVWFYEIPNPIYAYIFNQIQYKFYRPLNWNKEGKFLSSRDIGNVYGGYEQLPKNGKYVIITKAMKDIMTLYSLGIPAIAPNGETYTINPKLIAELRLRFDKIFLMLDNDWHKPVEDNTGINAMKIICQQYKDIRPIIIPDQLKCTDIAEVMDDYGIRFTKTFINESLQKIY